MQYHCKAFSYNLHFDNFTSCQASISSFTLLTLILTCRLSLCFVSLTSTLTLTASISHFEITFCLQCRPKVTRKLQKRRRLVRTGPRTSKRRSRRHDQILTVYGLQSCLRSREIWSIPVRSCPGIRCSRSLATYHSRPSRPGGSSR